jgi:hypothetical protein
VGTTGLQTIKLKGTGKAILATQAEFTVQFGNSFCLFTVNVVQGTSGGGGTPAVYSLLGSPTDCISAAVAGTYQTGTALNTTNTVTLQVNVTTIGSYIITAGPAGGMNFTKTGAFTSTGAQTVTLAGSGTPATVGQNVIPVTAGSSTCSFKVNVTQGPTGGTIIYSDYFPTTANSNWTYKENSTGDTARVTASATTTTFAGNTYTNFTSTPDNTKSYYRKAAGFYYEYGTTDDAGIYDTVLNKVDYIFLKDNVAAGNTWESQLVDVLIQQANGKAKIKFTLVGKNIQKNVGGVLLDSVMQVQRDYMFQPGTIAGLPFQTLVTANFYYAKNIGFVNGDVPAAPAASVFATRWDIR